MSWTLLVCWTSAKWLPPAVGVGDGWYWSSSRRVGLDGLRDLKILHPWQRLKKGGKNSTMTPNARKEGSIFYISKKSQQKRGSKSTILKNIGSKFYMNEKIGVKILQVWKWGSKFHIAWKKGSIFYPKHSEYLPPPPPPPPTPPPPPPRPPPPPPPPRPPPTLTPTHTHPHPHPHKYPTPTPTPADVV